MNYVLVGSRGAGKSAVAKHIAESLHKQWLDADVEIERRAGKPIAVILVDNADTRFRNLETDVLKEFLSLDDRVLALGGGVVLRDENRELLLRARATGRGKVVWLKASPETLHQRIEADPTTAMRRPKLTPAGGLTEVRELLAAREDLYRQCADLEVDTENKTVEGVAAEITKWVREQKPDAPGAGVMP